MTDVEDALQKQDLDRVPECLSDKWLADTTLFGSATEVRDGIEAWFDSGDKNTDHCALVCIWWPNASNR